MYSSALFSFNTTPHTEIYTLSLHDALPISVLLIVAAIQYHRADTPFEHASRPYELDEKGRALAYVVKKIEGSADTYQLLRRDLFGEPYYYRLLTNAFSMSATNPRNQRYMILF